MVKSYVSEPEPSVAIDPAQEKVTYLSAGSPTIKVLIDNTNPGTPPTYARFDQGQFTTDDPEVIKKLDTNKMVYRSDGKLYSCPLCGIFSTYDPKVFGKHMTAEHA